MNNIDDMYDYLTKNRKLKLEEYDDSGELIDAIEFDQRVLKNFLSFSNGLISNIEIARKKDKEYFKDEDFKITCLLMHNIYRNYHFDKNMINIIENILTENSKEEIYLALDLIDNGEKIFSNLSLRDYGELKSKIKDFESALKWIKRTDGIYFAINNNGEKCWTYLNRPTKKQAKYQRQKHGRRIVFWNFRDWKEYVLTEEELI